MKHLLDINVLLAAAWLNHPQHAKALVWLEGKEVALCPLTELGFLRISTQPKLGASMEQARTALEKFAQERLAERIPDDLPALESHPSSTKQVTDIYLCALAAKHGFTLATFDGGIAHPAAELIAV